MAIIQFPGTDFHDLNLDWVLAQVKNLLTEWASTKEEWETLKGGNEAFVSFITTQWNDFRTYVENYLANLPLTEEVSAKINTMVEDGTLLELITHDDGEGSALSDVSAQWLSAHITQETGYVIDDTLTVQGAAADAKATGDAISDVKSQLETGQIVFSKIAGFYINNANGEQAPYAGWSCTDFIDISKLSGFNTIGTVSQYNAYYDENKTFISTFATLTGNNTYYLPANAKYIRLSDTTARMSDLVIYGIEKADYINDLQSKHNSNINEFTGYKNLKGNSWGVGYIRTSGENLGFVDSAGLSNNNGKRIIQTSIQYAVKDIVISIADGYQFAVNLFSGNTFDTFVSATSFLSSPYKIAAGTYYIIGQIKKTTDEVSIANYKEGGMYDALTVHYADMSDTVTIPEMFGKTKQIVCFGNSLTMGSPGSTANPWTKQLQDMLGAEYTVKNHGVGGEGVQTIGGRQGGIVMLTNSTFTIPATTDAVEITLTNMLGGTPEPLKISETALATPNVNPVYIKGIAGALSYGNGKYYFRRNTTGDAVLVDRPTPIITKAMREERHDILILWTGENGQFDNDYQKLVNYENLIVRYSQNPNYLIISKSNNSYTGEWGTNYRNAMMMEHGRKFIDIIEYLVKYGLDDLNITPTAEDETAIANGVIPPSLKIPNDNTHLTTAAYGIVARLVYERGEEFGYWN